ELASFNAIKTALIKNTTLQIFIFTRPLFIDFNVSKYGIGIEIYYIKNNKIN
ncbi:hypothetical protein QBC45DRAFT_338444, partial [Copromyces sp. CBS 386.78]